MIITVLVMLLVFFVMEDMKVIIKVHRLQTGRLGGGRGWHFVRML
jgi:hypothetical protein